MPTPLLLTLTLTASTLLGPPPTATDPVVDHVHGEVLVDDYRWLEALDSESEAVEAWTTAQNEYTRSVLDALPGRQALESRLAELMSIGSVSTPSMRGNLYFYTERKGDENQPVLYVRDGADGDPRELINPNTLDARGLDALDWYVPSDDGTLLAFGLSHAGDEMTVLHLMKVATGMWLSDEIPGKIDFSGWAPDGRSFLYGKLEDPADAYSRSFRYHVVGRHHREDPLLFRQTDPSRIPNATMSRDGRWIVTEIFEGWSKQDVFVVDAALWRRTGEFTQVPVAVGLDARFAPQVILGDTLYMLSTVDAPNGMLYAVDLTRPKRDRWRVVLPERPDAVLDSVSEANGMLVASYEMNATSRFRTYTMDGEPLREVPLPGLGTASISTRYDRTEAFYSYTSFNEPPTIYRVNLATGAKAIWARPDVPVDPDTVVVEQKWCVSPDGTRVPMFIVHKKGLEKNGKNPTLLYGYGGFNISITPRFNATNFPWFEQGGIYVSVSLRGGAEFGEAWHQAGMLANKQNVFDDLYAAAEYLIAEGYTSPEHMAVLGGSNGGLLTGVAAMQRPDLWAAVVSAVPLLDMIRFPEFLMAKFWVPEYGDPKDPKAYEWLRAYSPYHNITAGRKYPAILFTAGENDNRVHPLHARKMAAALQARAGNDFEEDPILLWVDREGGHGQGKPLALRIRDVADRWSFIMWQTGMYYGGAD